MANQQSSAECIREPRATLEQTDQKTKAHIAERFHEADGLEVDQATNAPQVACNPGPQVAYSKDPLISLDNHHGKKAILRNGSTILGSSTGRLSHRTRVLLITSIAIVLTIGVGVGVGAGVGVSRKNSVSGIEPAPSTALGSAIPSTTSSIAPSSTPRTLQHSILNGSSFAAVSSSDGSKYVFFQDISGSLRQAYYSQTAQSWASDSSLFIPNTTDARVHTPLSAIILPNFGDNTDDELYVFYISMDNVLAARWYAAGVWATPQDTEFVNLASFHASVSSRSLSVSVLPNTNNSELIVYFEGPEGNVTALHGLNNSNRLPTVFGLPGSDSYSFWTWENLTARLQSSAPNLTFGSPFFNSFTNTSYTNSNLNDSGGLEPQAVFFDPLNRFAFSSVYNNKNHSFETPTPLKIADNQTKTGSLIIYADDFGPYTNLSTINQSDFVPGASYQAYNLDSSDVLGSDGYWVNGSTLASLRPGNFDSLSSPKSSFPYTRMATLLGATDNSYSLFHQIDSLTIAEDVWDTGLSGWTSFNISISAL